MRARTYDFREAAPEPTAEEHVPPHRLGLRALLLALAASGGLLYLLGGSPQLPVRPDPRAIVEALRSADPALQGAASWCFALAWALWFWTAVSLLVQGLLFALERLTGGAAWIMALRPTLAPLMMPMARRAFPVFTAGIIVARLAVSPTPSTAAAPAPLVLTLSAPDQSPGTHIAEPGRQESGPIEHVVIEGETLWALAERYYGTGDRFPVLHEANLGRPMPDGTRYEGRLRPGQVLVVPSAEPAALLAEEQFVYTVERGDTLRAIAARFLGDEMRWPEIYAINRGIACLPDGRTLAHPDLIWPGLPLTIPASLPASPSPPVAVSPNPPPASPAPAPPSSAPTRPPSPSPPSAPPPVGGTPAAGTPTPAPTATATPATPAPATPTAVAPAPVRPTMPVVTTTPVPTVAAAPRPTLPDQPAHVSPGRAPLIAGAGALGAAVIGTAVFLQRRQLLARRELRRRLRAANSPAVLIREVRAQGSPAFAHGDLLGTFTHRAHGGEVEPAVALAHHAARFLAQEGIDGATPLLAAQGARGDAALLVGARRAERDRLVALAPAIGTLLGGGGRAVPVRASGDVELRLTGLTAAELLAPPAGPDDAPLPTMLPLAELPGATPLFANWDALGNLLIAGGPGEGADIALTGLVATLASRRHPDTLRLWAIAQPQELPPELFDLPHWGDPRIDPGDRAGVAGLLADLRAELDRRREEPPDTPRPDLVLILAEAADVFRRDDAPDDTTLQLLASDGPGRGIRLVAATARPEALDDGALQLFPTRLALRLADEAQSVRLLGVPDATALPGGGRLLLRLAERVPRPFAGVPPGVARGYRIAPEALAALAVQLGRAYGLGDRTGAESRPGEERVPTNADRDRGPVGEGGDPHTDPAELGRNEGDSAHSSEDLADEPAPESTTSAGSGRVASGRTARGEGQSEATTSAGVNVAGAAPPGENGDGTGKADAPTPQAQPARATRIGQPDLAPRQPDPAVGEVARGDGANDPPADTPPVSPRVFQGPAGDADPAAQSAIDPRRSIAPRPSASAHHPPPASQVPDLGQLSADIVALDPPEEPPLTAPLDIRCFGPFRVLHAGEQLAPRQHAKAWELLQLLAAHPPRSLTKERLWVTLWPEYDNWPSRNIFNTIIGRLRDELTIQVPGLPREVVQKSRASGCWLDPDLVAVDVHRWLAILKREPKLPLAEALGEYRLARALYRPTLLEGASYEWLTLRDDGVTLAEDYAEQWGDYRLRLARRCMREGRPDLAVPLYRALLDEQPREEAFARELFRCYGRTGDLPGLERQMRALEAALRAGYGDEADPIRTPVVEQPESETAALFTEVRSMLARGAASGTDGSGG